jgi:hypothetical protein
MDHLTCDGCGEPLLLDADVRYVLRIEGYAAYDPLEITKADLARDLEGEMQDALAALEGKSAEEAQDEVHRRYDLDLCATCWREYVKDPLAGLRRRE